MTRYSSGPLVVEKHRHRPGQPPEVSFYACGPVRGSLAEAEADAVAFGDHLGAAERVRRELVTAWRAFLEISPAQDPEGHKRAFEAVAAVDDRLRALEAEAP